MTHVKQTSDRWQVWLVGLGDLLRTSAGDVRFFDAKAEAEHTAREVGGIVQIEGAPALVPAAPSHSGPVPIAA